MELKHYRLIKTITEEGNIANSSSKLFLTQSALSHQLRELEKKLGFKVFNRSRNKWQLTNQGEKLYVMAKEIFQVVESGFKEIHTINQNIKNTIRVGTNCYFYYKGLIQTVNKIIDSCPFIDIDLSLDEEVNLSQKTLSKELDISITSDKITHQQLHFTELFKDEILAFVHKKNPLAQKEFLEASDFEDLHLTIHSFPLDSVSVYKHFLKPNGIEPKKVTAIPLTQASIEIVNANMGIFCVPEWLLKPFNLPPNIIPKKISKDGLVRSNYLVCRVEDRSHSYIQAFVNALEENFHQEIFT